MAIIIVMKLISVKFGINYLPTKKYSFKLQAKKLIS